MRYSKKAIRNVLRQTTRVDIIDNITGQVVASYPTTGGSSREAGVGIANRNADAELARLNAAAEAEVTPEGITKTEAGNYASEMTGQNYSTLDEAIRAEEMLLSLKIGLQKQEGYEKNLQKMYLLEGKDNF